MEELTTQNVTARLPEDLADRLRRAVRPGGRLRVARGVTSMTGALEVAIRDLLDREGAA